MTNWPEEYRVAATAWVEADALARLYDETKTAELARRKTLLGDMPDSKAERIVKASQEWMHFINKMVDAKTVANKAKVALTTLEMAYWMAQNADATARAERRMY